MLDYSEKSSRDLNEYNIFVVFILVNNVRKEQNKRSSILTVSWNAWCSFYFHYALSSEVYKVL